MRRFETYRDNGLVYFVLKTWNENTGEWEGGATEYCKTFKEWELYCLELEFESLGIPVEKIEAFKAALRAVEEEDNRYD